MQLQYNSFNTISYKIQILLQLMKSSHNLSFSCEQNRVDYHYIPENYLLSNPLAGEGNLTQLYQRSLSSSFLGLPQLQPLPFNSSLSLECQEADYIRKRESSKSEVKHQNLTKVQFCDTYSIIELGLQCLVSNHKISTKNVLRNFGNAQCQYVLHNKYAQQYIQLTINNKEQFESWVRKLKLLNFIDYKNVWMIKENDATVQKLFKKTYKKLCWRFYEQQCIPYIFSSRLTLENKKSHLLQVYKMLKGILNPANFDGFKQ